jgi:membrane protein implicated in regulation of membrane protease activity
MFTIPVEDFIFVVCALIGGGLLLITVLVDDVLGAVFDLDVGGVSLMPLILSFVSMFGVGGLFATQVLDVHGGQAALWGAAFGLVGMGIAYVVFAALRRSEAEAPFSTADLVGHEAYVQVSIPAGRYGSVLVRAEGQTHEFSATASADVPSATVVRVTGVAGPGLIVEPVVAPDAPASPPPVAPASPPPAAPGPPPTTTGTEGRTDA